MKVVIDTNVILDVLSHREPFFEQSRAIVQLAAEGKIHAALTANTITDIYYVLRKHLDKGAVESSLRGLMELFDVVDVTGVECLAALDLGMNDYEDALMACCALRWGAGCIVTRNTKDFRLSPVMSRTPEEYLRVVSSEEPPVTRQI